MAVLSVRLAGPVLCACLIMSSHWAHGERLQVTVEGVEDEARSNVLLLLEIARLSEQDDLSDQMVKRAHNKAEQQIQLALQPFGYYSPLVAGQLIKANEQAGDEPSEWTAHYNIQLGARVHYGVLQLDYLGPPDTLPDLQVLLRDPPIKQGEPLDHRVYGEFKNQILDTAYNAGYLDARMRHAELGISQNRNRADVTWQFDPGPLYRFGEIELMQDILDDDLLRNLVDIERGEVFEPARLVDAQIALTDSGFFNVVEVEVERDATEDAHIPVSLAMTPVAAQKYSTYFGFGTDTGPRLGAGAEFRRLNRRGHQLSTDIRLSAIRSSLGVEYGIPVGDIRTDRLNFFVTAEREDVRDAQTDQFAVGSRLESNWRGLRRQLYVSIERENFSFGDGPSESSTILSPGIGLTWQRADDPLFTRRGISAAFDLHGGHTNLLSDTTFVQTSLSANLVLPLSSRARLLLRGELGATWADEFDRLPPSERFFTGGDRTVRGYAYESISPENAAGDEIGAEYLSVFSAEVDFLLRGNYGMAVFYDVGSAADELGQDLRAGVGIGLRYRSPVGLVRIDFAHPLDDPDSDFRLHLTFGPDL